MRDEDSAGLGPEVVFKISHAFEPDDNTFIIGGQATNLWAWYFQPKEPVLQGPFTSRDIDYFGSQNVARNVADRLGAKLYIPEPRQTPRKWSPLLTAKLSKSTLWVTFSVSRAESFDPEWPN